ncbi:hypothetical protein Efla_000507 [Eimeria flavescens]
MWSVAVQTKQATPGRGDVADVAGAGGKPREAEGATAAVERCRQGRRGTSQRLTAAGKRIPALMQAAVALLLNFEGVERRFNF